MDKIPKLPTVPDEIRTVTFIDGQNLYHQAKRSFGYEMPNFDPIKLSEKLVEDDDKRILTNIRLYTGIARKAINPFWNIFWTKKLEAYSTDARFEGITIPLAYGDGTIGREKGIDARISLDLVRLAHQNKYDLAIIFSQDTDLLQAVIDIEGVVVKYDRWVKVECAFPVSNRLDSGHKRGLPRTRWVKIDKATYDSCIDPKVY